MTEWVINAALKQLVAWRQQGIDLQIACNLSVRNIEDDELVPTVRRLLDSHGLSPEERGRLEFEVTESGMMTDPARALHALQALKELGPRLSIDDFGTGHSSLAYLAELPVDIVKIDQVFAIRLERAAANAKIIHAAIGMARDLGFVTAVEGIENADVLKRIRDFGADLAQGYYFAKPMPIGHLDVWLNENPWGFRASGAAEPSARA